MANLRELIEQSPEDIRPYEDFLRERGWLQQKYPAFLLTHPIDMDLESSWIDGADLSACCAFLTALIREDHFSNGSFRGRVQSGMTARALRRMESLLAEQAGACFPEPQNRATIQALYEEACRRLPVQNGIYQVEAPPDLDIRFLPQTAAGEKRLYPAEVLQRKWQCGDHHLLYIGKAQRKKGGLRKRVWEYLRYGYDGGTNHRGGRGIWQVENFQRLYIHWFPLEHAGQVEHQLLASYQHHYGVYPAANHRG